MPELLCLADRVDKLTAVCMKCGSDHATRTQRLINGFPADKSSPLIMIGGDETYEARCLKCYELPDKKAEEKKKGFKLLNFVKYAYALIERGHTSDSKELARTY